MRAVARLSSARELPVFIAVFAASVLPIWGLGRAGDAGLGTERSRGQGPRPPPAELQRVCQPFSSLPSPALWVINLRPCTAFVVLGPARVDSRWGAPCGALLRQGGPGVTEAVPLGPHLGGGEVLGVRLGQTLVINSSLGPRLVR